MASRVCGSTWQTSLPCTSVWNYERSERAGESWGPSSRRHSRSPFRLGRKSSSARASACTTACTNSIQSGTSAVKNWQSVQCYRSEHSRRKWKPCQKKRAADISCQRLAKWSWGGSNPRPSECHSDALPAAPQPHRRHVGNKCRLAKADAAVNSVVQIRRDSSRTTYHRPRVALRVRLFPLRRFG